MHTFFFIKKKLYMEPTCRRLKYLKNLYSTKKEIPKEHFDLKNFYNYKHQELKSWFHSFVANTHIDCLLFVCQVLH